MVDRLESGLEVIKRKENKRTAWQSWRVVSKTDLRHEHEPCLRQRYTPKRSARSELFLVRPILALAKIREWAGLRIIRNDRRLELSPLFPPRQVVCGSRLTRTYDSSEIPSGTLRNRSPAIPIDPTV
jgi:hypothetical protein